MNFYVGETIKHVFQSLLTIEFITKELVSTASPIFFKDN